jgi:hypothetical protein
MEPDPTNPGQMRQTAYCGFCAAHRPDEDWRWPCEAAGLLAEIDRLCKIEAAAAAVVEDWYGGGEIDTGRTPFHDALRAAVAPAFDAARLAPPNPAVALMPDPLSSGHPYTCHACHGQWWDSQRYLDHLPTCPRDKP